MGIEIDWCSTEHYLVALRARSEAEAIGAAIKQSKLKGPIKYHMSICIDDIYKDKDAKK